MEHAIHPTNSRRTCGDVSAQICLFPSSTSSFSVIDACIAACFSVVNFAGASLNARPFAVSTPISNRPGAPDLAQFLELREGVSVRRETALVAENLAGEGEAANASAPESERRSARGRRRPPCTWCIRLGCTARSTVWVTLGEGWVQCVRYPDVIDGRTSGALEALCTDFGDFAGQKKAKFRTESTET